MTGHIHQRTCRKPGNSLCSHVIQPFGHAPPFYSSELLCAESDEPKKKKKRKDIYLAKFISKFRN
jgi:hypothetical protein